MPSLELKTNAKIADAEALALEFSKVSAEILGKPEGYITVSIIPVPVMVFSGSAKPCFTLLVTSLGNLNPAANEQYSIKLAAFLKEKLGLEADRGYITFYDPGNAFLGYQGTTFATIFGK